MSTKKYTHMGIIRGYDARVRKGWKHNTSLRETKLYWITTSGRKFHKSTGICTGDWPLYQLDLATIKENDR